MYYWYYGDTDDFGFDLMKPDNFKSIIIIVVIKIMLMLTIDDNMEERHERNRKK